MRKIKIAAGLAHVDYGNISDLVKQVTVAEQITFTQMQPTCMI